MLSTFEIILNAGVSVVLLPLAVHSLITHALPPEQTFMGRLYRVDPYVARVGDVFLVSLCLTALAKLALHFGFIDMSLKDRTETITHVPFIALLVIYLTLLIRGWCKLRRTGDGAARTRNNLSTRRSQNRDAGGAGRITPVCWSAIQPSTPS